MSWIASISDILAELASDARASQIELAEKVGLSPTACARRIRQLEEIGMIRGYRADIEPAALGLVTTVVVTITLEKQSEDYLAAFEAAIARCPDVVSCHLMSGSDDYHLQVMARDIADFERIHKQHLSRMPGRGAHPFELRDARSGAPRHSRNGLASAGVALRVGRHRGGERRFRGPPSG